jgi:hypothetical protein
MYFEDALHWYRRDRFTADDVTRATGLPERSQRELLKLGIISAVPQARTKARLLTSLMLKRAAIIAPLQRSGLSLGVAGRIVYAAMMLEDLVYDIVDPWAAAYDAATAFDHETGLFQPRKLPHNRDTWFDPAHPPATDQADFFLSVINSKFVMFGADNPDGAFGELTPDLTDFIWWDNAMYDDIKARAKNGVLQLSVLGIGDHSPAPFGSFDNTANPKTLAIKTKTAASDDEKSAEQAKKNPVSMLTINASLALRVALRRLLYIEKPPDA